MTLEQLIESADALRHLPDEEAEAKGLPALVDKINAIRALEDAARRAGQVLTAQKDEAEFAAVVEQVSEPKRRGRPPKAKIEGADA